MLIVKLGGSVITDKTKKYFFKQETMDRLASEIKKAHSELILVHGAGSFGHILAEEYQLNKGLDDNSKIQGFSLTHAKVQELNSLVLKSLHKQGIPAVSIPPHAILELNDHKLSEISYNIFDEYLKKGFVPITFGDVVLDKKLGVSICSGDLLVQVLSGHFKPEKVIFVIDEDGIYSANPKIDKNAKFIETVTISDLEKLTTTADVHADVTEGMKGKINTIKTIAQSGVDTVLLNGNQQKRLYNVLVGKDSKYTHVHGGK